MDKVEKLVDSLVTLRPSVATSSSRFRLGIAARLSIAFAAVAILVAAANLIVDHGISIVRTTRVERVAEPQRIAPSIIVPAEPKAVAPTEPLVARKLVSPNALISAVSGFERAVSVRTERNDPETDAQLRSARTVLEREEAAYVREAIRIADASALAKLSAAVKSYKGRGEEAVRLADSRRSVINDYSQRLESMKVRMKRAVDRSFKIFGRVIARQYLIQMDNDFDEIRTRFENLNSHTSYEDSAIEAIASSEAKFTATLALNEGGLIRSQGTEWVTRLREDFSEIIALRNSLLQLNQQTRENTQILSQENAKLTLLADKTIVFKVVINSNRKGAAAAHVPPTPVAATQDVAPLAAPEPAVQEQTETTAATQPETRRRVLIAWISAGVLLLLVIICVGTVSSIVGPVGRLLKATARLANGDTNLRVPRGGIKELDTLAIAFNEMADQLSAAQALTRGYQQQLEAKVDERTHQLEERSRQLQDLAEQDPLTLLPNRRQLFALLNVAVEAALKDGRYVGVFFLDLDNFKNINDSMGHAFGDRVLIAIAQRLSDTADHFGFAARLGGDEFTVVYASASTVEEIRAAGWQLVRAFQTPLAIDGREIMISVSIGASVCPDHEQEAEALLRAADAALFRAKALGRSQLNVFTPDLLDVAAAKFTTEQGLRRAVERGEFELMFQPEVSLDTFQTVMVEALLRWRMPDGRFALPGEFLAVAEESGLIMEISDWVLESAIEAAAWWHHGPWPEARVAINVSPRQLLDAKFADRVWELLTTYRLPPRCIEIELTETVLQTGPATIAALRDLRTYGIAIALDDFGTGYSTLASLEQLPLTRIKLDRSLIASVDTSTRSAAIARAIIGLCQSLSLEVTAEGVERPEQLAHLLGSPSLSVQGYLLSRPVSRDELLAVMETMQQHMQSQLLSIHAPTRAHQIEDKSQEEPRARLIAQR
ncbi:MAG: putative bifunctional diguanylate cyclase/phosphodiesterase [Steroidobacteraceae bacterium]